MKLSLTLTSLLTALRLTAALTTLPPSDELQIRNILALFSVAIDTKQFSLMSQIFTPTAYVDYSQLSGGVITTNLTALESYFATATVGHIGQHSLTTILVEQLPGGGVNSTSYLVANFYGQGDLAGEFCIIPGTYLDSWTETGEGWRIGARVLNVIPPGVVGNTAVLAQ